GTLVSNIPGDQVEPGVRIKVAGTAVGTLVRTFGDVARGQLVALVGSGGTVEIAVLDGSAARMLGVGVGAEVRAGGRWETVQDGRIRSGGLTSTVVDRPLPSS